MKDKSQNLIRKSENSQETEDKSIKKAWEVATTWNKLTSLAKLDIY